MKIRKRTNVLSQLLSSANKFSDPSLTQRHICQLNQSPWDVFTFSSNSSPSLQFNQTNIFTGNGNESLPDPIEVVQSEASIGEPMEVEEKEKEGIHFPNIVGATASEETIERVTIICSEFECMQEAKEGNPLCKYHLTQMRKRKTLALALPTKDNRKPNAKKPVRVDNGHGFYYYSGFGPSWGKKRGLSAKNNRDSVSNSKTRERENKQMDQPYSRQDEMLECVEYEVGEDDDNDRTIRKKARKRIKTRSLNSLMSREK